MKAIVALFAVGAVSPLFAQAHDHGRPAEQLGRVVFPVSCNVEAQHRFERAMALLHSFWWEAGQVAFRGVAAADSTCAMAYWGLALNYWGNPFAGGASGDNLRNGATAAARAQALGAPTARERGLLAALGALYRDYETVPNPPRLQAYSDTLARVYRAYPDDPEVAMYYALSLVATAAATDTTFARQKQAAAILNPLFRAHPEHPGLAHYIIHANDSPALAALGLDAARRYAQIAPSAPHAQHMPSHIFVRLGLWDETIAANQRAFAAGVDYAQAQQLGGVVPEQLHALDYTVYGYLQEGRDSAARATVADGLQRTVVSGNDALVTSYNRIAMELRIPLERGDWAAAARLPLRATQPGIGAALAHFARGVGAVRSGDTAQARAELASLDTIASALRGQPGYNWSRVVGIKRQVVAAWLEFAAGDTAGALADAHAAADAEDVMAKHPVTPGELLPARELEGDLLLAVGRYAEARAAYDATLKREPGRARSIFGAGRAAELAGDRVAAGARYDEYLRLMEHADGSRPELAQARRARGQQPAPAPPAPPAPAAPADLFTTTEPLVFTLETDLRRVLRDRGTARKEHGATLRYVAAGGETVSLPVDLRTRGIFRLKQCVFPPLRLDFPESRVRGTAFAGQDKVKLVTHCEGSPLYEQNVLQEYVLYRIFNVLTERSFRARLARVTYRDTTNRDQPLTRYAVLLEAEGELARRLSGTVITSASVHDLLIEPEDGTLVAVFQYLIGNTDWSIWGRHNITIVRDTSAGGGLFAIPYDFDFAGVIFAPYAVPSPQLPIKTVRERLYRGYCQPDTVLLSVLARFRAAKDSIYTLYRSVPDLSARNVKRALDYFDAFYGTINDPRAVHEAFVRGCRRPSPS